MLNLGKKITVFPPRHLATPMLDLMLFANGQQNDATFRAATS